MITFNGLLYKGKTVCYNEKEKLKIVVHPI